MKVLCAPTGFVFPQTESQLSTFVLYGRHTNQETGSIGGSLFEAIRHHRLNPTIQAWDLLSIALAITAADTSVKRATAPDGWTRQIDLTIAVTDPSLWTTQIPILNQQLRFLTTDVWNLNFVKGIPQIPSSTNSLVSTEDCVTLLSGGLDSLVGASDLVAKMKLKPVAVSYIVRGDSEKQITFAQGIGGGLRHVQLNHNFVSEAPSERSQRARSFIFLAYGVLVATTLQNYLSGDEVRLFVCENGFISLNPPLTNMRLGSLSTRTTHPYFLRNFQTMLDAVGLRVLIENPYQHRTKGEMLRESSDQFFMEQYAHISTSCGRFTRNNYKHCGRCLPCLIRRAAFLAWGKSDKTVYVYDDLSKQDEQHAWFDDVRSAGMAISEVRSEGLDSWLGSALLNIANDRTEYRSTIARGIAELELFYDQTGIR